jgi:hypothetical protein
VEKIFSARIDEAALDEMERVTRRLKMTKRKFLEEAIHLRARQEDARGSDVWSETLGSWKRKEKPETTIRKTRAAFQRTFLRHHREKRAHVRR